MKYHKLYIDTDGTRGHYDQISKLLELEPTVEETRFDGSYTLWTYQVESGDDDPYFDFINEFLNILEPKFNDLEKIGVKRNNILFWLLYQYDQQCAMEFHPQEMKRLGESGIHLNIDCWQ